MQTEGYVLEEIGVCVCQLKKTLYGEKKSSREYNATLNLGTSFGCIRGAADPSLHSLKKGDEIVLILAYIDEIVFSSKQKVAFVHDVAVAQLSFEIRALNRIWRFISILIVDWEEKIFMHRELSIMQMLKHFKMENCKSAAFHFRPD